MIHNLRESLEKKISKTRPDAGVLSNLKTKSAEANKEKELYWKHRSKDEDKNTKYAHNSVKKHKVKNSIQMFCDSNGYEHFLEGSKGNIATTYFREMFTSFVSDFVEPLFDSFVPRVTVGMNASLTAPITDLEVKQIMFRIKDSSVPGANGLTESFYQQFWGVGEDLTREIKEFFRTSMFPHEWNFAHICLIPKVTNPTMMMKMRLKNLMLMLEVDSSKAYIRYIRRIV